MIPAELRAYRKSDLPALHALDQVCFPPGIAYSRAELRRYLEHPRSFTAVAHGAEHILGFAVVRPMRRSQAGKPAEAALHVLTIDVDPRVRRNGIGKLLMQWVSSQAERLSVRAVVLEVAVDNVEAQGFYAFLGFTRRGTIPGYYGAGADAFQMELSLQREV